MDLAKFTPSAFENLKRVLQSTPILAYFNPLPQVYTEIVVDASSMGLTTM